MDFKSATNEELLNECMQRGLLSATIVNKILNKQSTEDKKIMLQKKADVWIILNPDLFNFMEKAALNLVAKNQRFSSRLLSEEARWLFRSSSFSGKFKISDVLVCYIMKRLIEKHPEIKNFVKIKI